MKSNFQMYPPSALTYMQAMSHQDVRFLAGISENLFLNQQ